MSARSMTGYARARKADGAYDVTLSVKSVNHRGLDIHFRMPPELDPFEPALRGAAKRSVARGHLQVQVKYTTTADAVPALVNEAMLGAYMDAFRRMSAVHGLTGEPDLNSAFRIPGMFDTSEGEPDAALEALLVAAFDEAVSGLNTFREREGREIVSDMRARTKVILDLARRIDTMRGRATTEFQSRLTEKLAELLKNSTLDPQ
ncbi:MAG TPA: YicC/YloC family endoribonuclease, partial [Bryobacteraceae bacterium]|nr:YicC/YloC family endoribonuclease [Bryobacteraceae bacterium]